MKIRQAGADELPRLREIEVSAGRRFAAAGMPDVAAHPATGLATLRAAHGAGSALVRHAARVATERGYGGLTARRVTLPRTPAEQSRRGSGDRQESCRT